MKSFSKACFFALLVAVSLFGLEKLFILGPFNVEERISGDNRASFSSLPSDSLDVVYVGASNVYAFWQAPLAWNRYGLASHTYTNSSMPPAAIRFAIQECRKTQPNALYVVNVNNFKNEGKSKLTHCHWTLDNYPMSPAKYELIQMLSEQNDFSFDEQFELFFPIVRFHSTWSELTDEDFAKHHASVGGGATNPGLFGTRDMTQQFKRFARLKRLEEPTEKAKDEPLRRESIDDLIAYCKRENVSILFVNQPQAITNEDTYWQIEGICEIISDAGMDIVDLSDPSTAGLFTQCDFKDGMHTNVHGSIKYTDYLSRYIMSTYDIPDRRNDERYEEWNDRAERYEQFLMAHTARDFEFSVPTVDKDFFANGLTADNRHLWVSLSWNPAPDADEYLIYRQRVANVLNPVEIDDLNVFGWQCIAHVTADTLKYHDTTVHDRNPLLAIAYKSQSSPDAKYIRYDYSVIPVKHESYGDIYGSYYVSRASIEILSDESTISKYDITVSQDNG